MKGQSARRRYSLPDMVNPGQDSAVTVEQNAVSYPEVGLHFVSGVILRKHIFSLELVLWRYTSGNVIFQACELEAPVKNQYTGDEEEKNVFLIITQSEAVRHKVIQCCEAYQANLYPYVFNDVAREKKQDELKTGISEMKEVYQHYINLRGEVLGQVADNIHTWYAQVIKIKAIYAIMNYTQPVQLPGANGATSTCYQAKCWAPEKDLDGLRGALHLGGEISGASLPPVVEIVDTEEVPPTFNRTNRFTKAYQTIVNAYGVPTYREVNPTPFIIITFPFLFAVMFGDAGHGLLMALGALGMIFMERKVGKKRLDNEMVKTIYGGRYIILLMGIFSIYTGMLYNDIFGKPVNIFGSSWQSNFTDEELGSDRQVQLNPDPHAEERMFKVGDVYPFGTDPVWVMAKNKILFTNSLKMKLSIILGVLQMLFGVILSSLNHTYFRRKINIFCELIPQMLFLCCIFLYLCFMIFYKWIAFDGSTESAHCAPSLLIHLINMCMLSYPDSPCSATPFYPHQKLVQTILILLALVSVPWLLIPKPLIIIMGRRKKHAKAAADATDDAELGMLTADHEEGPSAKQEPEDEVKDEHAEEASSDIVVHQCIHTIEFCLGCISHTASYLRLWALSLAHNQLSEVLWHMVFAMGLHMQGYLGSLMLFAVFGAWAVLTVSILLVMEGLSAFLHALRLHWVEFQSKFYEGAGNAFRPFTFNKLQTTLEP